MDRIDRILKWMESDNIQALLVSCPYNVRYISQFSGDTAYLYLSSKRQALLTDSRYTTWAKAEAKGFEVVEATAAHPYEQIVFRYMEEDGAKTLGFENRKMIYSDVMKFKAALSSVEMKPVDEKLDDMRCIKSTEELAKIKEAERIGDDAFSYIITKIKKGMTELEVALELELFMKRCGAQRLSFETIAASGPNSAMPHYAPGRRVLLDGDFLILDFGCVFEGYCSDMTRTVVIGNANERQRELYETTLAAQTNALQAIRAGVAGKEVDQVARDTIKKAGYGEYFGHGLGHSVGLNIHETPCLSPRETRILQENMTETVEPGIYIPGFGGVRIEDLVIIKQNGYENLTASPKELIIIT